MNQSGQTQIDIRFIERTIGDAKPEEVNTQLRYVIEKGYARDSTTKLDPGDKRELLSISITVQGIDVVDGTTADPGVVLGNL